MRIDEWFDPENVLHLEAYDHLLETGRWPDKFPPKSLKLTFPEGWKNGIDARIAKRHMNLVLKNQRQYRAIMYARTLDDRWLQP